MSDIVTNPILFGDFEPNMLAVHLTKKPLSFPALLESAENAVYLQHLYSHNIRPPTQLIRAATRYAGRSWLQPQAIADKTETCLNLAISQAKNTIKSLRADVLLAGVLGCPKDYEQMLSKALFDEMEECLLLMVDLGVDCIFFEGFDHFDLLKTAVSIACRLTDLPLAPFLTVNNHHKVDCQSIVHLADQIGLEMVGWQGQWNFLQQHCTAQTSVFAWALESLPDEPQQPSWISELSKTGVNCILGAPGLSFIQWRKFVESLAMKQGKQTLGR